MTVCILFSIPGYSQTNPFPSNVGLTKHDLALLNDAAKRLYTNESAALGTTESWRNEKSGNWGTVTVVKLFQQDGHSCKKLEYHNDVKGQSDIQHYSVNWCQVGAEWKIL